MKKHVRAACSACASVSSSPGRSLNLVTSVLLPHEPTSFAPHDFPKVSLLPVTHVKPGHVHHPCTNKQKRCRSYLKEKQKQTRSCVSDVWIKRTRRVTQDLNVSTFKLAQSARGLIVR